MAFLTIICGQAWNDMRETAALVGKKVSRGDFELLTWVLGHLGKAFSAADYAGARRQLGYAARQIGPFFQQYDVLVTPTLPLPPVMIGALQPTESERRLLSAIGTLRAGKILASLNLVRPLALATFSYIRYLAPFNVTGQPAVSLPLHMSADGLPVGSQLVAAHGREDVLVRVAAQLEEASPWPTLPSTR
ncbi:MAG TPA: 6-aminohexanoate-cyclic-dimer hydrolase [Acidimicrobiaceae bacterium]|nr:6-aminohexanoate-cyclic-dimer hydrolase [Acidimicrobiaceae bacterium]